MEKTPLQVEPLDPLRRVFVPIEKRTLDGAWTFKTSDGEKYLRHPKTGAMVNVSKTRGGKAAKKARRQARAAHANH